MPTRHEILFLITIYPAGWRQSTPEAPGDNQVETNPNRPCSAAPTMNTCNNGAAGELMLDAAAAEDLISDCLVYEQGMLHCY